MAHMYRHSYLQPCFVGFNYGARPGSVVAAFRCAGCWRASVWATFPSQEFSPPTRGEVRTCAWMCLTCMLLYVVLGFAYLCILRVARLLLLSFDRCRRAKTPSVSIARALTHVLACSLCREICLTFAIRSRAQIEYCGYGGRLHAARGSLPHPVA